MDDGRERTWADGLAVPGTCEPVGIRRVRARGVGCSPALVAHEHLVLDRVWISAGHGTVRDECPTIQNGLGLITRRSAQCSSREYWSCLPPSDASGSYTVIQLG